MGKPPLKYILIGAGAQGRVTLDILLHSGHEVLGFLDDSDEMQGMEVNGKRIIGKISHANEFFDKGVKFVLCVGNNIRRKAMAEKLGIPVLLFGNAVHSSSVIFGSALIGRGNMIFANTFIGSNAKIGNHVIINNGSLVEHDSVIEDFASISPACCIGGRVTVKEGAFLAMGVTVLPRVTIGENSIIGAGSVVVGDVPPNVLAYGVPARVIKGISLEEMWESVL